jgi:Uma2 family endonuclease
MSIQTERPAVGEIVYPDCDGEPMSDNTLQWEWMVTVKGGVDALFRDDPDVFVAGDLLWYPVEGDPTIRMAPDVMVVFGRPKGYRGSYMQWREGGIAPQVVFEILSPGNRAGKMIRKFQFYDRYGVEEYYVYNPETYEITGWLRSGAGLQEIPEMAGWVSPRLGIRFGTGVEGLKLYGPDGRPFASYVELAQQRDELAQQRDELAQQRDAERQRAERLAAQLRALGLEPES